MKNQLTRYFIENAGPFIALRDCDINELCTYDIQILQVPAMLYINPEYKYSGQEILLTHTELQSLLFSNVKNILN